MDYSLRPHQSDLVEAVMSGLDKSKGKPKPVLAQAPTAFGKSYCIAEIAKQHDSALILSPSKEITEQNYEKLLKVGIPSRDIEICSASMNSHRIGRITLGTIGTVKRFAAPLKDVGVVIIDEAQVSCPDNAESQYVSFLNELNTNRICGLSATPWKNQIFKRQFELPKVYCRPLPLIHMDGGKKTRFGEWFWSGGVVYHCGIKELQQGHYLAPINYIVQKTDWSFVDDAVGKTDYNVEQLGQWTGVDDNRKIFERALNWAAGSFERTIVFTPTIANSQYMCHLAEMNGIKATTLDSANDNKRSREKKLEAFRKGEINVIFNVGVLTTGYDLPSLDCVILTRPTKSLSLFMQMVGRSIRTDPSNPDKVAQVVDMSGNLARFGRVEDIRLEPIKTKSSKGWEYMRESILYKPLGTEKYKILDRVS